ASAEMPGAFPPPPLIMALAIAPAPFSRVEAPMTLLRPLCKTGVLLANLLALVALGCAHKPPTAPDTGPPTVTVAKPVERQVTGHVDFTARTDAIFATDIRPRVTGYLVGMPFKEGASVKKDDVLFEIDDRPYKATFEGAKAELEFAKAAL